MKKKICIITSSFPHKKNEAKNAGIFVKDFAMLLSQENFDVFVIAPQGKNSHYDSDDIKVEFFPWFSDEYGLGSLNPKNPLHLLKLISVVISGIFFTRKFIKNNKIDVCLAMWAVPSGLYAYFAQIFLKTPYFVWALGIDILKIDKYPFGKSILKRILKNAQTLFANGFSIIKEVEKISNRECHFLAANRILDKTLKKIDYDKFDQSKTNFIFVGRYHKNKGIDILIEAIGQLSTQQLEKTLFHIFGGGPLENQIKQMVKKLEIESNTFVNGYLNGDDVFSYLSKSDFVIIPSRVEAIPIILLDSLESGKPVITTEAGDMGDLVKKYNAGFVVTANPKDLVQAIQDALSCDEDKLNSFRIGGDKLKSIFDLKKSLQTFKEIANLK